MQNTGAEVYQMSHQRQPQSRVVWLVGAKTRTSLSIECEEMVVSVILLHTVAAVLSIVNRIDYLFVPDKQGRKTLVE